jgi:SMC interacting uncharacterized protein involved in chromosome segregation
MEGWTMATAIAEQDLDLDLDALEADAREKIEELSEQIQRLAPEALRDEDIARELMRLLEAERLTASRAIEQVNAAREELGRRGEEVDAEAKAQAEVEAREAARVRAAECAQAVHRVDAALNSLAEAYRDVQRLSVTPPTRSMMNAALGYAFSEVRINCRHVFEIVAEMPRSLVDSALPKAPAPVQEGQEWRPAVTRKRSHLAEMYREKREVLDLPPEIAKRMTLRHLAAGLSSELLEAEIAEIEQEIAEAA